MKTLTKILFPVLFLAFTGCNNHKEPGETGVTFTKSFVQVMIDAQDLVVFPNREKLIPVVIEGKEINNQPEFNYFLKQLNDLSYNKILIPAEHIVIRDEFSSLLITSAIEVNGKEPGESLNEYFYFVGFSPKDYIKNNYTIDYNLTDEEKQIAQDVPRINRQDGYYPIVRRADKLTADDLFAIEPEIYIIPGNLPTGGYELTITIQNDKKELSASVEINY